jgi:hypothetical protein
VVSTCCAIDSARLAVTSLALRRLASRSCHICHASMPTRATDRQSANATVQVSHAARAKVLGMRDDAETEDRGRFMTDEGYGETPTARLTQP